MYKEPALIAAYADGYTARTGGATLEDNPYLFTPFFEESMAWVAGWNRAAIAPK